ncbi:MAG: choice-of-anchor Q domain-containing protein [Bacteroidota bacterium]
MNRTPMPYLFSIVLIGLLMVAGSCREDFEYRISSGHLEFSKDTVFLDTVFTNIGSSTYTLKVYNRSNDDIAIPFIGLENGQQSAYRLNVDGLAGKEFADIALLAKDSLYIFIETTIDIEPLGENEFLYTDAIQFGNDGPQQKVPLVTLVRDAIFLYPRQTADGMAETLLLGLDEAGNEIRIEGFVLENDKLRFTSEKPYVIYGYAAVTEENTLTIDAGARVHFHKDSGILVSAGATLQVNGLPSEDGALLENEVIFEGDRLEPEFEDVAGQWGTIWLAEGSRASSITHLTIKNATVGILVEGGMNTIPPTLTLSNTQVYNSASTNLWARSSSITAANLVLGSAGETSLYCNLGGSYDFNHSTIANYWNNGFRNGASVQIDNFVALDSGEILGADLISASFSNCIIDGNRSIELLLQQNGTNAFHYLFDHCSIQFEDFNTQFADNPLYDFENADFYQNVLLNANTDFLAPFNDDFRLGERSDAIDAGSLPTAMQIPLDLQGMDRTLAPDLGAYEYSYKN